MIDRLFLTHDPEKDTQTSHSSPREPSSEDPSRSCVDVE